MPRQILGRSQYTNPASHLAHQLVAYPAENSFRLLVRQAVQQLALFHSQAIYLALEKNCGKQGTVFGRDHEIDNFARCHHIVVIAQWARPNCGYANSVLLPGMAKEVNFGYTGGVAAIKPVELRFGLAAMGKALIPAIEDRLPIHRPIQLFPGRRYDYEITREGIRVLYSKGVGKKVEALVEHGTALARRTRA